MGGGGGFSVQFGHLSYVVRQQFVKPPIRMFIRFDITELSCSVGIV